MDALERYIREMSTPQHETLAWVERQSWLRTSHGRQVSGPEVGALLRTLVRLMQARRVLEIGTFSGYATLWMAEALPEDGRIDTIEINDEMEDLIREGFERAGLSDRIRLHIGDALDLLPTLDERYDLVFIDADKRLYKDYYDLVMPYLNSGGYIIADNTLWDGHVVEADHQKDPQTRGIMAFNDAVAADSRVEKVIIPVRDGLTIIRKL